MLTFVKRYQTLVDDPRQRGFHRRQNLPEKPEHGMPVRQAESLPAQPFHLPGIDLLINRRLIARRAAQARTIRMQHNKQNRCRTSALARLPRIGQGRPARSHRRPRNRDLKRMRSLADKQTLSLKSRLHRRRPRPRRQIRQKPRITIFPARHGPDPGLAGILVVWWAISLERDDPAIRGDMTAGGLVSPPVGCC